MFFHISNKLDTSFPNTYQIGKFCINLDNGWDRTTLNGDTLFYKGYLDYGVLSDEVTDIVEYERRNLAGNFCILKVSSNEVKIMTDVLRSFPIFSNADSITNLKLWDNATEHHTDRLVTFTDQYKVVEQQVNVIYEYDTSTITFSQVVEECNFILENKIKTFVRTNTLPIKMFVSGGIDTMLLYSYLKRFTDNFELVTAQHIDYDYFLCKHHGTLEKTSWGFKNQYHHWNDPCILVSGTPGDEFGMRSPFTANLICMYHGFSISDMLADEKYIDAPMYEFCKRYDKTFNDQIDMYKNTSVFDSLGQVIYECCERNINDYQHWHIGNTLFWTPLRDLQIFQKIARLGVDDLKNQIMYSSVQRELIECNDPLLLSGLSEQKNTENWMSNLPNVISL